MVLLCDHLQDPHNLGAVIRSATAGASAVMIPKRGGALPTGTVVKTSAGAALRLPIAKTGNISQTIRLLQEANFWVVGLSMEAEETLFKEDMPPRVVIVIGAEGEGLGQAVAKSCDELRHIPWPERPDHSTHRWRRPWRLWSQKTSQVNHLRKSIGSQ